MHTDPTLCLSTAELIKLASDKEEQQQASRADQIQKLVRSKLQRHNAQLNNSHRQFTTQLADVKEEEELAAEAPALIANSRAIKDSLKAPGRFPFPFANNRLKKVPPHPYWNCRNPLHYNRNCASWRSQGRPENKSGPTSKASKAYAKAYLAMLEEDELSYDVTSILPA